MPQPRKPKTGYPESLGKGAGAGGTPNRGIAEDAPGWSGYGVRPTVRRKPQEAHTPSHDMPPGTNTGGGSRQLGGINPSTNAIIRSGVSKTRKRK